MSSLGKNFFLGMGLTRSLGRSGVWGLILFAAGAGICRADLPLGSQRLSIAEFTVDDGLRSSHILDLEQDLDGQLWIQHRLGVSIWDGRRFETLVQGLRPNRLGDLAIDGAGVAWLAQGWGEPRVYRRIDESWRLLPAVPRMQFSDAPVYLDVLHEEQEGASWIALATADGRLWTWAVNEEDQVSEPWSVESSGLSPGIHGLVSLGDRFAIAGERGLCFLIPEARTGGRAECPFKAEAGPSSSPIHALWPQETADGQIRLWLLGQGGAATPGSAPRRVPIWLGTWQGGRVEVVAEPDGLPALELRPREASDYSQSLALDDVGGIYFGNAVEAFYRAPDGSVNPLSKEVGFEGKGINALWPDDEGGVWIGSSGMLSRIGSARFFSLNRRQGLLEDEVTAVLERDTGELVLAHNSGLSFIDRGEISVLRFDDRAEIPRNAYRVFRMAFGLNGDLWLATYAAGLLKVDAERRVSTVMTEPDAARAFARDADDRLWIAGAQGLWIADEGGLQPVENPPLLGNVRDFEITADGTMLIAMEEGLLIGNPKDWRLIDAAQDRQRNLFAVKTIGDQVWLGSLAGPMLLKGEELHPASDFRLDSPVFFLFEAPDGAVWMGTDDGVRIWDGTALRKLSVRHGLSGRDTNRGAGFVDSDGRIWVGTDLGVSLYRPLYDLPVPAPRLHLREIEVGGELHSPFETLNLKHDQSTLTFRYRMVSLNAESPLRLRYGLVGYEQKLWEVEADSDEARYTNLPPGTYSFRIQAGREDDAWGDWVESAAVEIQRPLWRTPSFIALVLLLGTAVLTGAFRLRTRSVRRRAKELETMNRRLRQAADEREALIAGLEAQNVELEQFNFTVSHDLKTPLVNIRGFVGFAQQELNDGNLGQAGKDLERIDAAARHMNRLLDDLRSLSQLPTAASQAERVPLDELIQEVVLQVEQEGAQAQLEIELSEPVPEIFGDRPRLRLMLHQVLDNAVKFNRSERPWVILSARQDRDRCILSVRDNGIGIPESHHEHVFGLFKRLETDFPGTGVGLTLVYRIVKAHGGEVWVESRGLGHGSTFFMTFPCE